MRQCHKRSRDSRGPRREVRNRRKEQFRNKPLAGGGKAKGKDQRGVFAQQSEFA